ncbi:hypothetical protein HMPREF1544_09532 [Mucor circinelloides 1006PhL]|uniref:Translin n=1 Tax=Mucor circinelloides f. circinelloides (strain 1006PhL) TaxID=1220926 RepID=S2J616_MUCC1|nr:hypothetical protein HMPREF1544_09532 [Mucor circinelloides 1006PhL]
MIFALHRAIQANNNSPNYQEADQRQKEIIALFKKLAVDIQGLHYHRSFSGGFEEFIEAIAFYHFLVHKTVITKEQVDGYFKDEQGQMWVPVKTEDYILGLADCTGELMRYAIYVVSTDFDIIATSYMPQLSKKLGALKGSIKKVEQACYTFQIRGSEYPKEMYLTIIKNHQDKYEQEQNS